MDACSQPLIFILQVTSCTHQIFRPNLIIFPLPAKIVLFAILLTLGVPSLVPSISVMINMECFLRFLFVFIGKHPFFHWAASCQFPCSQSHLQLCSRPGIQTQFCSEGCQHLLLNKSYTSKLPATASHRPSHSFPEWRTDYQTNKRRFKYKHSSEEPLTAAELQQPLTESADNSHDQAD